MSRTLEAHDIEGCYLDASRNAKQTTPNVLHKRCPTLIKTVTGAEIDVVSISAEY